MTVYIFHYDPFNYFIVYLLLNPKIKKIIYTKILYNCWKYWRY